MTTREELLSRGLPKWPQMLVTGKPVSVEQAKEIIRRTDTFFTHGCGGNNHDYNAWVREVLGMPKDWFSLTDEERDNREFQLVQRRLQDHFVNRWGLIATSYVTNSWVSCAFAGGPHGWIHPDGHIGFVDNVGKWPSIEDVAKDWEMILEAFPFLEIGVTLVDRESDPDAPPREERVVSMAVRDGAVLLVDPVEFDVHAGHEAPTRRGGAELSFEEELRLRMTARDYELGLPDEWIEEWGRKFNTNEPAKNGS